MKLGEPQNRKNVTAVVACLNSFASTPLKKQRPTYKTKCTCQFIYIPIHPKNTQGRVCMDGRPPFATGFESLSVSNRIGSVSVKTHRCIYSGPENACVTRRCPPRGPEWQVLLLLLPLLVNLVLLLVLIYSYYGCHF